jgi:ATP-binding cassette subfamily F protein uup
MAPPLLHLQDIRLSLGTARLLAGAELAVGAGERLCLVGRNGSGKSTLLKIAAGQILPDSGTRFLQPGATLRTMAQEPDFGDAATTLDYVMDGLGPNDDPYRGRALLDRLGLDGTEHPGNLSGGEARRAALARALAPSPDILLLDEPTNHLDLPAIEWLESELGSQRAGIVLISHDRRMLTNLSRNVAWLDRGIVRRLDQGFAAYEAWRDEVLETEESDQHKLGRQIRREEDWMRYGVTARRKRNVRRVGELAALRQQHREGRKSGGSLRLEAASAEISGKLVAVAEHVTKSYGERPVVADLSMRILRGDRTGIVGPNGAGKTTLLNLLTGRLAPDAGSVTVGASLEMVTLDQLRATLDPAVTLQDTLTGGGGDQVMVAGQKRHVIGYMKDFLFRPEQARTPVGVLSGGERGRLMLACALARPSNLLVLDEPTNDLDLETLDLLQEMLGEYKGTVLLVSHDRDFLDRVVSSTLAAEGEGAWVEYAGGYSDMLVQRGTPAPTPGNAATPALRANGRRAPAGAPGRVKMSFRDQRDLAELPLQMEKLQAEAARLRATLSDAALYSRDPKRFNAASAGLAAAEAQLQAAEERWLTLEMQREAIAEA